MGSMLPYIAAPWILWVWACSIFLMIQIVNGGETMPFLPPMTGNGLYHIKIAMTGGWVIIVLSTLMDV